MRHDLPRLCGACATTTGEARCRVGSWSTPILHSASTCNPQVNMISLVSTLASCWLSCMSAVSDQHPWRSSWVGEPSEALLQLCYVSCSRCNSLPSPVHNISYTALIECYLHASALWVMHRVRGSRSSALLLLLAPLSCDTSMGLTGLSMVQLGMHHCCCVSHMEADSVCI